MVTDNFTNAVKVYYLPPILPISNNRIYVSGDVTIHPSAAVASGAVLQAAPNSKIVIGAGAIVNRKPPMLPKTSNAYYIT